MGCWLFVLVAESGGGQVSVPAMLHTLGLVHDVLTHRELPFARDKTRSNEGIRPVHWANRPDA